MSEKGCFIVIEGIDGAGKTSQINTLVEKLKDLGYSAVGTCEPTRTETGLLCRKYLKNPNSDVRVDALLFAADRMEHYLMEILPLLNEGKIVISDRYKMSSYVYQQSQGVPLQWIQEINKFAPEPDLTFFLDISLETAIQRISQSEDPREKFENIDALKKIKQIYETFAEEFIRINGETSPSEVTESMLKHILKKCQK